ncbi:ATP-binding protein [Brevundimonas sp. NPDC092305]|uniref:ATP-binding protein n=1 Tax=Brevundimonas sp. NPDC092305 TaxID=3363957 RepID=UPI00382836D8
MDRIYQTVMSAHDWRWTTLAVVIALVGVPMAFKLLADARSGPHRGRGLKGVASMLVGCLTLWSTHFVAMQGFHFDQPIRYDGWLTLASYGAAVASVMTTFIISIRGKTAPWRALSGSAGVVIVVVMVLLSVRGIEVQHRSLSWDTGMIWLSVLVSGALGGLGATLNTATSFKRLLLASWLAAASVIVAHFLTVSALIVAVDPAVEFSPGSLPAETIQASATGAVAVIIAIAGFLSGLVYWSRNSAIAQIREAVDAMPDGMAFYDANDRLVLWNARYDEVNPELSSKLVPGMTFREVLHIGIRDGLYADAHGREEAWIAERMAARQDLPNTFEQHIIGDGWLRIQERRTAEGGIVTVVNDITDLKRAAQELSEARDAAETANTAKSQFLANMSHEIRTPLNGVIGVAQVLASTSMTPQQTEMVDLIKSSGDTLQVLLNDLLDLARVESGQMKLADEAFDLGRAVREAAQLYGANAREKGLQFFVEIDPAVDSWASGDVVRVKQILTNLVSNAVKFTSEGFVGLTVAPGPASLHPTIRFSIEDTGIGFDSATRDRLFSRFEQADGAITRKFGGSGLGLAISRQLAEMMGGHLDCESEPGGGSAFMLTLPWRPAAAPATPQAIDYAVAHGGDRVRVLLADDHPVNRKVVEMILAQAHVDLTSVEDGAQAVHASRETAFDLILMDMQMPVMDGLTATREIRLHEVAMGLPRSAIVMLTANALAEHITAAEDAGADRHLAKPFDASDLLSLVVNLPSHAEARAA